MVIVTNRNDFIHADRYDGQDFVFPPGARVLLSAEAARHMFGYGLKDKEDTLVRLGWAMRFDSNSKRFIRDSEGPKKLANFLFEEQEVLKSVSRVPHHNEGDLRNERETAAANHTSSFAGQQLGGPLHAAPRPCETFLRNTLNQGPMPATEVLRKAREAGHSEKNIRRAKRALGVASVKQGGHFAVSGDQQWVWQLCEGG